MNDERWEWHVMLSRDRSGRGPASPSIDPSCAGNHAKCISADMLSGFRCAFPAHEQILRRCEAKGGFDRSHSTLYGRLINLQPFTCFLNQNGSAARGSHHDESAGKKLSHSSHCLKKGKGKFLYSAVSNPQDCSKRCTFYFPDRPVNQKPSPLLWEASRHI